MPIKSKAIIILCLTIILLNNLASAVLANFNPFAVVPKNHWSYAALNQLEIVGSNNLSLEMNSPLGWQLTRVEMALKVAGILNEMVKKVAISSTYSWNENLYRDIDALVSAYNELMSPEIAFSDNEVQLLKDLVEYFRTDLEVLGYHFTEQMIVDGPVELDALARTLGRFTLSGESVLSYSDSGTNLFNYVLQPPLLAQKYTLHVGYWDDNINLVATVVGSLGQPSGNDLIKEPILKIDAINIGLEDGVIARVGDLSDSWLDDFLIEPVELEGVQAGYMLGRLGSTVILARDKSMENKEEFMAALDGTVYMDSLTLGATLVQAISSSSVQGGTIASVQGSYILTPGVVVVAGLAGSTLGSKDASALRLEGIMQLNEYITLSAGYRSQGSGFQRAMATEADVGRRTDIDFSFSMGETTLSAAIQRSPKEELNNDSVTTTSSLEIRYPLSDLTTLSASRQEIKVSALDEEYARFSTTAVGIDFLFPAMNMNLRLGATLQEEWAQEQGARPAAFSSDVGLEYEMSSGTVSLGYKVEIPGMEQIENEVTAQVTIRF